VCEYRKAKAEKEREEKLKKSRRRSMTTTGWLSFAADDPEERFDYCGICIWMYIHIYTHTRAVYVCGYICIYTHTRGCLSLLILRSA
jgi:hypothetical protein